MYLTKTSPKSDILVLFTTFILTVVFDLVVAIEVGIILACILLMKRMSDESGVKGWKYVKDESDSEALELRKVPKHIRVYEICGPMFFAAVGQLGEVEPKEYTKCIIFRMRSVPSIDADAIKALRELVIRLKNTGITVIFSHVNEQPMRAMKKAGLIELAEKENFCPNINEAIRRAEVLGG